MIFTCSSSAHTVVPAKRAIVVPNMFAVGQNLATNINYIRTRNSDADTATVPTIACTVAPGAFSVFVAALCLSMLAPSQSQLAPRVALGSLCVSSAAAIVIQLHVNGTNVADLWPDCLTPSSPSPSSASLFLAADCFNGGAPAWGDGTRWAQRLWE